MTTIKNWKYVWFYYPTNIREANLAKRDEQTARPPRTLPRPLSCKVIIIVIERVRYKMRIVFRTTARNPTCITRLKWWEWFMLQVNQKEAAKPMHLEDLAALKVVSEDTVLDELQNRHLDGLSYTFVGDVLLYMNPNRDEPLYEKKVMLADTSWKLFFITVVLNSNTSPCSVRINEMVTDRTVTH